MLQLPAIQQITAPTTRRSKTPWFFFSDGPTQPTHDWGVWPSYPCWNRWPEKSGGQIPSPENGRPWKKEIFYPIGSTGLAYSPTFWLILKVNVGKHTIHRFCGYWKPPFLEGELSVLGRVYVHGTRVFFGVFQGAYLNWYRISSMNPGIFWSEAESIWRSECPSYESTPAIWTERAQLSQNLVLFQCIFRGDSLESHSLQHKMKHLINIQDAACILVPLKG